MRKALKNPSVAIGLAVVLILVIVGLFAKSIATHPYWKQDLRHAREAPSTQHIFGTDTFGRDIFSRVVYGARISMATAFSAAALAGIIGITLGLLAGYFGGRIDLIVQGFVDITWSLPSIVLGLSFALLVLPGQVAILATVVIGWWSQYARVIRSETLVVKSEEYILAAESIGCSNWRIITKQIIPNVVGPVIVLISLTVGQAIIVEATLSFLGVGIRPPTPSWGLMLSDARAYISSYPWMVVFPGVAISLTVLAFNLIGDGLRDILDPYLSGKGR